MADTERLMNKAQGDDIISALATIAANILQVPSEKLIIDWSYTTLPASGNDHTIYAIPTGDADDPWDFYVWNDVDEEWVQFDWNFAVDSTLSTTSENPVQNKVVTEALNGKVDAVTGKGLSTNDYTNDDKASVASSAEQLESTQTVSGNPITLTDAAPINAESLVVELEPKQDLHGYDYPWVGGAGYNKLNYDEWSQSTVANGTGVWENNGVTLTATDNDCFTYSADYNLGAIDVNEGDTVIISWEESTNASGMVYLFDQSGNVIGFGNNDTVKSLSLTIASGITSFRFRFGVNANGVTISYKNIMVQRNTSETTFAPYSNICPITGYTECEVDDVGFNQWDEEWENGYYNVQTGDSVSDANYVRSKNANPINIEPQTEYCAVVNGNYPFVNDIFTLLFYDENGTYLSYTDLRITGGLQQTFTTPQNARKMRFYLTDYYGSTYNHDISINYPSTFTEYEPYHSSNATIQFGQTVMGGKVNVTDGGTSETMSETVLDGTTAPNNSFERTNTVAGFVPIGNQKKYATTHQTKVMCDSMPVFSPDYVYENDVFGVCENISSSANGIWVSVYKDMLTSYDMTGLQAWLVANNLQIAYELETNVDIATTPTDLKLLKGTNHITTNGTTINLGYQPDNVVGEVKGEIQEIKEMPYLRILDNDVDTEIKNYRLYYRFISSAYTLVNLEEMLRHRFLFVEVIRNPSGTANHELLHSALIDPRTIDGFEYGIDAGSGDTICIQSIIAENKFELDVRYTGSHTSGDPTDYYVTIRMVD